MKNLWSVHLPGSLRKSGKDLWRILTGSSVLSGMRRREWKARRVLYILDGVPQVLRRSESVLIERGWKMSNTVPNTDLR